MTLHQKRVAFTRLLPRLIDFCFAKHYDAQIEQAYRPPELAALYAAQGKGISNSLHGDGLAIDLSLFVNGELLKDTDSYREVGEYWESLSTDEHKTCWGGRFSRPDGNHFSLEWQGRR